MMKNNYGKGSYEFLTVAVVCLILTFILLVVILDNANKEKIVVLKYNAKIVGVNAISYSSSYDDTVYLYELVNDGLISNIKNTFGGDKFCDLYESKVEFVADGRKVTLQCGDYLVYKENVSNDEYNVYKTSEWSSDKITGDNVFKEKKYTIVKNGKNLLNGYYEKDLFVKLVAQKYGNNYNSLKKIEKKFNISSKWFYRKMKLID